MVDHSPLSRLDCRGNLEGPRHSAGKEQAFLEIEDLPAQGHPTRPAGGASVNRRLEVALAVALVVVAIAPISLASAGRRGHPESQTLDCWNPRRRHRPDAFAYKVFVARTEN